MTADTYEQAKGILDAYLAAKHMRRTPERYEVLRVVMGISGQYSIDQLCDAMQRQATFQVSRATLFNVISLFVEAQMVVRHVVGKCCHFETNISRCPIIYQQCVVCNQQSRIDNPQLEAVLAGVKSRRMSVVQRVLYLGGICRKCEAKRRKKLAKKTTTEISDTTKK